MKNQFFKGSLGLLFLLQECFGGVKRLTSVGKLLCSALSETLFSDLSILIPFSSTNKTNLRLLNAVKLLYRAHLCQYYPGLTLQMTKYSLKMYLPYRFLSALKILEVFYTCLIGILSLGAGFFEGALRHGSGSLKPQHKYSAKNNLLN